MHKLEILRFPDPLLRNKGQMIDRVNQELVELGQSMLELMYKSGGVGLAAVQVGKPLALLAADTRTNFNSPYYQSESSPTEEGNFFNKRHGRKPYSRENLNSQLESRIKQPLILFNPKVLKKEGEVLFQEGCLSFPSYYAEVKRAGTVTVEALNIEGDRVVITTDGLLSICLQHEIDHLHGKLFIDHLSPVKARRLREEIKKHGYPDSPSLKEAR